MIVCVQVDGITSSLVTSFISVGGGFSAQSWGHFGNNIPRKAIDFFSCEWLLFWLNITNLLMNRTDVYA